VHRQRQGRAPYEFGVKVSIVTRLGLQHELAARGTGVGGKRLLSQARRMAFAASLAWPLR
jgi:hypothetical protein